MFTWVSAYGGIVSTKLLADKDYVAQTFLPKLWNILHMQRDYLRNVLHELNIPYTTPDAAFFIFVDLSRWLSHFSVSADSDTEIALLEYLLQHGVFLEPGRAFFSALPGFFRLSFGSEKHVFRLGLGRLVAALGALDSKDGTSKQCTDLAPYTSSR